MAAEMLYEIEETTQAPKIPHLGIAIKDNAIVTSNPVSDFIFKILSCFIPEK